MDQLRALESLALEKEVYLSRAQRASFRLCVRGQPKDGRGTEDDSPNRLRKVQKKA